MDANNYSILIVDDDLEFHIDLRRAFRRKSYTFDGAETEVKFNEKIKNRQDYDLVLMDLVLQPETGKKVGLKLIAQLKKDYPDIPIIIVTVDKNIRTVVEAMKLGAKDFLHKDDFDPVYWDQRFQEAIEVKSLRVENQMLREEVKRHKEKQSNFIGESPQVKEIKRTLRLIAEEPDLTLLLTGETGVGKEVAARYFHQHGPRSENPFQAVNLSSIQESLLESALFGHTKGAFTGAIKDTKGYFNQADSGVLLLDEIGDIDANIQIKLLRFLETRMIRPVGSEKDIKLNIQIVLATWKNLQDEIAHRRFRDDLFYRIDEVIHIPPLRDRQEDIIPIIQHYASEPEDIRQLFEPLALMKLQEYQWPGNIRELIKTIKKANRTRLSLSLNKINIDCLPIAIQEGTPQKHVPQSLKTTKETLEQTSISTLDREGKIAMADLQRIENALQATNNVKNDAALLAGFGNTDNLRYRIRAYYDKHPKLFNQFPHIQKSYKRILKP